MANAAAAPAIQWAREYETIYILRSDVDNDAAEKVVGRARDVIERLDGTLTKLDNWGKRRLAYPIRKSNRGIFVYLKYIGYGGLVAELERNLRLLDEVVRFQTVLLREDLDPATIEVDPEEVQYLHVEVEDEPEDLETERARSLGMMPRAPREERQPDAEAAGTEAAAPATEGATPEGAAAAAPAAPEGGAPAAPEAAPAAPVASAPAVVEAPAAAEEAAPPAENEAPSEEDKPEGGA
ncbi:MAG: 30S ribosomal protein S6 [Myxococcota bacterium]